MIAGGVLLLSLVACVMICSKAERELAVHDPPAVILDEVWAMAAVVAATGLLDIGWLILAFGLFRLFDITKPLPLKHLAQLPQGWGIMADDVGAAGYTIGLLWVLNRWLTAPGA
jgi:phosphatidylglycerophosphatase A